MKKPSDAGVFVDNLRRKMEAAIIALDASLPTNIKVKLVTKKTDKGRICLTPLEEPPIRDVVLERSNEICTEIKLPWMSTISSLRKVECEKPADGSRAFGAEQNLHLKNDRFLEGTNRQGSAALSGANYFVSIPQLPFHGFGQKQPILVFSFLAGWKYPRATGEEGWFVARERLGVP